MKSSRNGGLVERASLSSTTYLGMTTLLIFLTGGGSIERPRHVLEEKRVAGMGKKREEAVAESTLSDVKKTTTDGSKVSDNN